MTTNFKSVHAPQIISYIEMKHKLGYKFGSGILALRQFDECANRIGEKSLGISKELADKWCERRSTECWSSYYARIGHIIQFSRFLIDQDIESYVPKSPRYKKEHFEPHIYTNDQIERIFQVSDSLVLRVKYQCTQFIVVPAMLRVLYSTGLRISEVLALKNEDVNLVDNWIKIRDSKNGCERLIPISESLSEVCEEYVAFRNRIVREGISPFFFVSLEGKKCTYAGIYIWFRQILQEAQIQFVGGRKGPRIHDLRHTFAVTALASMANEGNDLYVTLPILSKYLGHQDIESTNRYVRLTAQMYPDLVKKIEEFSELYPPPSIK